MKTFFLLLVCLVGCSDKVVEKPPQPQTPVVYEFQPNQYPLPEAYHRGLAQTAGQMDK